ncbi:MAG: tetratricopeptide repeat protein, partial [Solobacterium sp.]|nr:tetratricopeptide repeat protein [Solobacterium sp.]
MTEEKMGIDVEKIVDQSTKLRKDEDYEGARRIDQEGYDRCVLEYGEKDPNTLRVLHFLAIDYERLGDLEKAVELYQKIYDAKRTTIGSEHKETLNVLVALSSLYSKLKQHEKAVETDEKIYEIRKRNLGPEHLDTLSALNNVAYDYRQLGQFENAKELDRRVYMKRKQLLGEEDSKTLSSAKHLAYDYGMLGDFENAIKVQEELCRILKEKLEPDNPLLLDSLTNLSTFYYETQKHEQARHVDEEIYHTQKLVLPENDENLVLTQENLAYDYHQLNDYEQAQTMDLSLLELKKASLGEEHEETILKMEHLAEDYYQLGNYEEAFKLDQVLFEKYPIIKGEDKTFIRIVNRLVVECEKLNQLELAQPYILKQLEFANDNEEVRVELLKNALQKFKIAKDYENAVKANQELVEYMKSIYGAFSKEAVEERYAYIQLLQEASLLSDVAREYEILYDLFDRNRGSDHEDTLLLQEDLARAYIHAGMIQPAEATLRNLYARRLRLTGENDEKTILIKKVLDKLIGEPPVEEAVVEEARVEEVPVEETQAEKDSDFLEKVKQYYQTCLEESGPNHKQTLRAQAFYACVLDDEKETPELLKDVYQKKGKFIFHIGHFDQEELDKKKEAQALWKVKNTTQALEAYRELKQMNQHLPSLHPDAVYTDLWYAQALRQEGKKEEQMELLKSIYERAKEVKLEKHDDVLPVLDALANEAYEKKEYNEAIHMHRELYSRWLHKKDANDLQT